MMPIAATPRIWPSSAKPAKVSRLARTIASRMAWRRSAMPVTTGTAVSRASVVTAPARPIQPGSSPAAVSQTGKNGMYAPDNANVAA